MPTREALGVYCASCRVLYGNRTGNWPGMIQCAADLGLQAGEDVNPRARRLEAKGRSAQRLFDRLSVAT